MSTEQLTEATDYFEERPTGWGRVLAAGTAVIAGLVAAVGGTESARADCQESPCCFLASCTECDIALGVESDFYCPPGYNPTSWTCNEPGTGLLIFCGECASGNNCDAGPWACSIWYYN